MYGRSATADKQQVAPGGSFQAQANGARRYSTGQMSGMAKWFPIGLVLLLALYFVWALLEQHEKIRTAVRPQNVGVNLRNIAVIMVTVILGLNLSKIIAAKLCAWNVPGSDFLATLVGGA